MTDLVRKGFAVVMADQADTTLASLPVDTLRQLLALYMHVHRNAYCDREGFFEGTVFPQKPIPLRQFVAERFGLCGHRLRRFMRSLNKSPLFESSGDKNENRLYRLAATAQPELLDQYQAFVAEGTEQGPLVHRTLDCNQVVRILGVPASLLRCPVHTSADGQPPLPPDVLRRELANRLASELLATPVGPGYVLGDDPALTRLVAELMTAQS